ncbi:MAG: hypothetical protein WCF96_01580 [Eubacteriales bacterium]
MININTNIVSDTVNGALILSIFDFFACFFVLYFISFFIRGITYFDEKLVKRENRKKLEKEQEASLKG